MTDFRTMELKEDKLETIDYDNLPEERGSYAPPIQPGTYEWALPANLSALWEPMKEGTRVRLAFSADPLVVVAAAHPQRAEFVGSQYKGSITGIERNRAAKGQPEQKVSDLQLLLRNGLKDVSKPQTNKQLMEAVSSHGGQHFVADVEWSAQCRPDKVRYVATEEGGSQEDPSGTMGCGGRVYQGKMKAEAGVYPDRLYCPNQACGAVIRAFENLVRFRAVGA